MKLTTVGIAFSAIITAAAFSGCENPAEKVKSAQENVKDANYELDQAKDAYETDIANYRKQTAEKIAANDKSIAEFNERMNSQKKEAKAEYQIKVAALEQKNSDLKKKMDDYKAEGKENWEKFKMEFSHDMDELGNAFKDLTVNNVK